MECAGCIDIWSVPATLELVLEPEEVRKHASPWPDGQRIEIRRCGLCGRRAARIFRDSA
jgi:hypothetical protein